MSTPETQVPIPLSLLEALSRAIQAVEHSPGVSIGQWMNLLTRLQQAANQPPIGEMSDAVR